MKLRLEFALHTYAIPSLVYFIFHLGESTLCTTDFDHTESVIANNRKPPNRLSSELGVPRHLYAIVYVLRFREV